MRSHIKGSIKRTAGALPNETDASKNLIHPNDRTITPKAMKRGVQRYAGDQGLHSVVVEPANRRAQAARMAQIRCEGSQSTTCWLRK